MFCIQDPSYDKSMYLHEALLSECVGCLQGASAYAFATKDGIDLLFNDDNFIDFLKVGKYTLIVGTDDITNENAIHSLRELKKHYSPNLTIKAYIHNGKGSTFHPKYSWFKKDNGGSIVLGSGNLTQKGLRRNREAYMVTNCNESEINDVILKWDNWYNHSKPFLFDVEDDIVIQKAKLNTKKIVAVGKIKKDIESIKPDDELSEIYKQQPKDKKSKTLKRSIKLDDKTPAETESPSTSTITDEEIDIDASYWNLDEDSKVLIAEIPKNGDRFKQVNFSKDIFENFFGATCGENGAYRVLLKNVRDDGTMGDTEIRPSVSVASHNYRFELDALTGLTYPVGTNRPIAIFAKISNRDFLYMLLMPEHDYYSNVKNLLDKTENSNRVRRIEFIAKDIIQNVPNLAIWNNMGKDKSI